MKRHITLSCAVALVLAGAASASTATIIGLIGKSTSQTQSASRRLDSVLSAGTRTWVAISKPYADVVSTHLGVARDLRTAFALGRTPPGYNPAARVSGVPASQMRSLDPNAFYASALQSHRLLNDRLRQILETHADEMDQATADRYRGALNEAAGIAPYAAGY